MVHFFFCIFCVSTLYKGCSNWTYTVHENAVETHLPHEIKCSKYWVTVNLGFSAWCSIYVATFQFSYWLLSSVHLTATLHIFLPQYCIDKISNGYHKLNIIDFWKHSPNPHFDPIRRVVTLTIQEEKRMKQWNQNTVCIGSAMLLSLRKKDRYLTTSWKYAFIL